MLLLCRPAIAAERVIEQHFTIRPTTPAWNRAISVRRHDPDTGSDLVRVDVRLTATITGTIGVQNPDTRAVSASVTYSTTVTFARPDSRPFVQVTPTYASSQALVPGASVTLDGTGTATGAMTTTAPVDLRLFTGTGSVNLRLGALKEVLQALAPADKTQPATSLASPLVTAEVWVTFHTADNAVFDVYRVTVQTLDFTTIVDTCRARSMGEARAAFESRHPGMRIVTIGYVPDAIRAGYLLYRGGIRTEDRQNIEDTCWALSSDEARRILSNRHPGGVVNHLGLYPANRDAVTWIAVVQRARHFEYLKASDLKEALSAFAKRYPRTWIVRVVQYSNDNEYRLFEGVLDPKEFVERVEAKSTAAASQAALAKFPEHRVLDVQFSKAGDAVEPYEGTVTLADGGVAIDTCPASSAGEARRILADRHGDAKVANLHSRGRDPLFALYQATISIPGTGNVVDTACARNEVEGRAVLARGYPTGNVGSIARVIDTSRISTFRGQISTGDGRNVIDTCWAASPAAARKVFLARFPEGGVRSLSTFGSNRPDVYEVTLKGTYRKDGCEARDKSEAMRILQQRYPNCNVVSVDEFEVTPEAAVYRAQINTSDHRNVTDTVQAKSSGEARRLLLARYPDSRLTSLCRATEGRVDETFQAQIDLGPAEDTVQADSSAEATHILLGRYPHGGITVLKEATGMNRPPSRKRS
jgi:uncharacterized membrane protein YkoI